MNKKHQAKESLISFCLSLRQFKGELWTELPLYRFNQFLSTRKEKKQVDFSEKITVYY